MVVGNSLENVKTHKKLGLGSLSLLLFLLGLLFSFSFGKYGAFGDHILRFIGINPWSNGDTGLHYTIFYALTFYIPGLMVGYKFKNDWGAKIGKNLSLILVVLVLFLVVLVLVSLLFFAVV
ncbi:hypothetical protein SAMN05878482_106271 [Peribacillus simplex]|uniref:Uncharacterized protein n=1 Tax=Peribacillus simplex TaxID=1478 RepID=A0A9X8RCA6_9BACI|nr:hypothetical protein [Peribacillus simplex]SIR86597.1 hypothetical protein SAMN05878482_106271 [Peribacillus simplex]